MPLQPIRRTAAGTTVGRTTAQKISLHGVTPVVQRVGAAQTALTDSTSGSTANATLAAVGATNGSDVSAAINGNFAKTAVLLNELRAALVEKGIIKGAA